MSVGHYYQTPIMSRNGSSERLVQFYYQSLQVTLTSAVGWSMSYIVFDLMESASLAVCDVIGLE